jgi:hypothetical protein
MLVADMIAMHMAGQNDVDFAEAGIAGAGHRAPRIVENARAVRVLEDHRPVELAEFSLRQPERRHLDALTRRRRRGKAGERHRQSH